MNQLQIKPRESIDFVTEQLAGRDIIDVCRNLFIQETENKQSDHKFIPKLRWRAARIGVMPSFLWDVLSVVAIVKSEVDKSTDDFKPTWGKHLSWCTTALTWVTRNTDVAVLQHPHCAQCWSHRDFWDIQFLFFSHIKKIKLRSIQ